MLMSYKVCKDIRISNWNHPSYSQLNMPHNAQCLPLSFRQCTNSLIIMLIQGFHITASHCSQMQVQSPTMKFAFVQLHSLQIRSFEKLQLYSVLKYCRLSPHVYLTQCPWQCLEIQKQIALYKKHQCNPPKVCISLLKSSGRLRLPFVDHIKAMGFL